MCCCRYFDLRGVSEPLECAHPTPSTAHDCDNPEVTSTDLVITKLTLEVDDRFGNYGRCNVCVNGTDHHGNNSCTEGAYWCNCGGWNSKDTQCSSAVGRQNLTTWLGDRKCGRGSLLWDCWKDAVGQKTCVDSPEVARAHCVRARACVRLCACVRVSPSVVFASQSFQSPPPPHAGRSGRAMWVVPRSVCELRWCATPAAACPGCRTQAAFGTRQRAAGIAGTTRAATLPAAAGASKTSSSASTRPAPTNPSSPPW